MARFRKVDPRIWNDAKFASLSGEAKLMFLYLLTSPSMTVLGALPMRASAVAEELGLDSERYGKRYQELYQRGMVEYDSRGLFWVRNYMKYNGPDNPKVVISWSSALDLLPECPLLYKVLESARNHCVSRGKGFPKAFTDTLGNCLKYGMSYGMPNKEKEKEKEKEYLDVSDETSSSDSPALTLDGESDGPKRAPSVPLQKIVDTYNAKLGSQLGVCRQLNKQRQGNLRQRWADISRIVESKDPKEVLEGFAAFYDKIGRSDFLMGRATDFKATFDWIHNSSNFLKIYEGNYENGRKR